jgi:hypothetical protein
VRLQSRPFCSTAINRLQLLRLMPSSTPVRTTTLSHPTKPPPDNDGSVVRTANPAIPAGRYLITSYPDWWNVDPACWREVGLPRPLGAADCILPGRCISGTSPLGPRIARQRRGLRCLWQRATTRRAHHQQFRAMPALAPPCPLSPLPTHRRTHSAVYGCAPSCPTVSWRAWIWAWCLRTHRPPIPTRERAYPSPHSPDTARRFCGVWLAGRQPC